LQGEPILLLPSFLRVSTSSKESFRPKEQGAFFGNAGKEQGAFFVLQGGAARNCEWCSVGGRRQAGTVRRVRRHSPGPEFPTQQIVNRRGRAWVISRFIAPSRISTCRRDRRPPAPASPIDHIEHQRLDALVRVRASRLPTVIAAECRDDLVGRIADQHVASEMADDVVFLLTLNGFQPLQSLPSKV
jgi:hypothetical protein